MKAEGRHLFYEECFYQENPWLRKLEFDEETYWSVATQATAITQANDSLSLYHGSTESNALPMERFLVVTHNDDALRWKAKVEMTKQAIHSGDMLSIANRTALGDSMQAAGDDSEPTSLETADLAGVRASVSSGR